MKGGENCAAKVGSTVRSFELFLLQNGTKKQRTLTFWYKQETVDKVQQ
jgi:hypothetical protein